MQVKDEFSYTKDYITKNGEPWFAVMGEIHYSRYPQKYWKEAVLKMKAGGVTIISTYTLWLHHEEIEGQYDFSGNKDLKKFVQTVKECGEYLVLRIGPWCHAECRNGGFPDWLLNKGIELRANNEEYFAQVEKYYRKLFEQVQGLLYKDGGPVIAVQIENEFGHCGGLTGSAGEVHMKRLQEIALKVGFDVPLYTATGWGGAVTAGMLPVMGGYVDAPWDPRTTEIEPSGNFVITYERNDHNIGSDFGFGAGITFDINKFPYLTAELGCGLQPTFKRRTIPSAEDIGAETLVKLASGVSLLGYYMYHGGTNPKGKLTTLQESTQTGSLNDLPELSYDFFAPIREYGQISKVYGELKLYSLFVSDFGKEFCKMQTVIPPENPTDPGNTMDLRWSYKINPDTKSGFLFVNNYVRHQRRAAHAKRVFNIKEAQNVWPPLDIADGDYFFLPFNFDMNGTVCRKAYATPLCRIGQKTFVFYENAVSSQVQNLYEFQTPKPQDLNIITLMHSQALNAYKATVKNTQYLVVAGASVTWTDCGLELRGQDLDEFMTYPKLPCDLKEYQVHVNAQGLFCYTKTIARKKIIPQIQVTERHDFEPDKTQPYLELTNEYKPDGKKYYDISLKNLIIGNDISDIFLHISYSGSYSRMYDNRTRLLIADNLFCKKDRTWTIGLRQFLDQKESLDLVMEIQGLNKNTPVYLEGMPEFNSGTALDFHNAELEVEYFLKINF